MVTAPLVFLRWMFQGNALPKSCDLGKTRRIGNGRALSERRSIVHLFNRPAASAHLAGQPYTILNRFGWTPEALGKNIGFEHFTELLLERKRSDEVGGIGRRVHLCTLVHRRHLAQTCSDLFGSRPSNSGKKEMQPAQWTRSGQIRMVIFPRNCEKLRPWNKGTNSGSWLGL